MKEKLNKKELVLKELYEICKQKKNFVFHNDLVKEISKKYKFGNPFDATKLDNKNKLPQILKDNDLTIIHLGGGSNIIEEEQKENKNGYHCFIKGINNIFHNFEKIEKTIEWPYKKSLLNLLNTSESNILSIANNQRILHEFAFDVDKEFINSDIENRPKTYFPHRTGAGDSIFFINGEEIITSNLQMEIDLTIEYKGKVVIFEAKNQDVDNFNIMQIYQPFYYYYNKNQTSDIAGRIKDIICVYLKRIVVDNIVNIQLWAYTFENPKELTSIKYLKSANYKLIINN